MNRAHQILLSLAFLSLYACADRAQSSSESTHIYKGQFKSPRTKFTRYKLANGLQVVLAPDELESSVAINISFDAGSRREIPGQAGAATLVQKSLLQDLRQIGGELLKPFEGALNEERASYFSELSASRLESVLSALAGQLRPLALHPTDLDAERLAFQNECTQLDESRFGRVQQALLELIYEDTAFRYGAICSLPDLNHLSSERVESFFTTYYVPNNAVLVIAGNFKEADAKKMVTKYFGAISRQAVPPPAEFDHLQFSSEKRKIITHPHARAVTYISAYLTVPSNHPDWYALNILADIIGQGDRSRLYEALVSRELAASVPEGMTESRGQSLLRIGAELLPGVGIETVETIIDAELARIQSDGVTHAEIDRARLQEQQYSAEQLGTVLGRASFLARAVLYYNDPNRINTELNRMLAVTAEDVLRAARKYLVKENRAVVIAQPAL